MLGLRAVQGGASQGEVTQRRVLLIESANMDDVNDAGGNGRFSPARWQPFSQKISPSLEATSVVILWGLCVGVLLSILGALVAVLWSSLHTGLPGEVSPLTLANYWKVLNDRHLLQTLSNTVIFASGTILVTFAFAIPLAWLMSRTDLPGQKLFYALMPLPIMVPGFLTAMAWLILLNPSNGILNLALKGLLNLDKPPVRIYSVFWMSLIQGLGFVPSAFFMMVGAFQRMDLVLEEAAHVSGVNKLWVFWRITLPLMLPAIISAILYHFVLAIEVFEIPAIIGFPVKIYVLSTMIYNATQPEYALPNYGVASAIGIFAVLFALLALAIYQRLVRQSSRFAVVGGKGGHHWVVSLGKGKSVWLGFVWIYFTISLFLPGATLIFASLLPYIQVPSLEAVGNFSLVAYSTLLDIPPRSLRNTLFLIGVAPIVVMVLSTVTSWIIVRSQTPGRRWFDLVSFLPHAVPSIIFALGITYLFLALKLPMYGTIFIILFAHILRYMGYGSRTMNASMIQIHRELDEAAAVSGVTRFWQIWGIIFPIIRSSFTNAWVWLVFLSLREVTMALMLYSRENVVITSYIWFLWFSGDVQGSAALGVVLLVVMAGGVFLLRRNLQRYFTIATG